MTCFIFITNLCSFSCRKESCSYFIGMFKILHHFYAVELNYNISVVLIFFKCQLTQNMTMILKILVKQSTGLKVWEKSLRHQSQQYCQIYFSLWSNSRTFISLVNTIRILNWWLQSEWEMFLPMWFVWPHALVLTEQLKLLFPNHMASKKRYQITCVVYS